MVDGRTPNFNLVLPAGNRKNWTDIMNGNLKLLDAIIATYVRVANLQGVWTNNTEYEVGDNVVDESSGVVYTAAVEHVSAGAPTTFLEERTDHPTYWSALAVAARNKGSWAPNTPYSLNDFVLADSMKYAMCIESHTSGASFSADLALGYWEVMIDLSLVGSQVLPLLVGAADANKIVMADTGGTSYVINSASTLAALLIAAGLAPLASPALTGVPTSTTPAAEDFSTKIATSLYADRAVRNIMVRQQIITATGTYTPNSKLLCAVVECQAGAGAGGAGFAGSAGTTSGGGGGGAGAYSRSILTAADIAAAAPITATIGAAGVGGSGTGGAGGDTSFGALVVAKGGSGGTSSDSGSGGIGGAGGSAAAGTGDFKVSGASGTSGMGATIITVMAIPGKGGASYFGDGAAGSITPNAAGNAATVYGAGGSGGNNYNAGPATRDGGNGGIGVMIVTEFCYG